MTLRGSAVRLAAAVVAMATPLSAQDAAEGHRLRSVLPADGAAAVIEAVGAAEAAGVPGDAVLMRALELRAKGASAREIVTRTNRYAERLVSARGALNAAGIVAPDRGELLLAAEALGRGVSPADVGAVVAADRRPEAVADALLAVSGLLDRGVPAADALGRVALRLTAVPRPPAGTGTAAAPSAGGGRAAPPVAPGLNPRRTVPDLIDLPAPLRVRPAA